MEVLIGSAGSGSRSDSSKAARVISGSFARSGGLSPRLKKSVVFAVSPAFLAAGSNAAPFFTSASSARASLPGLLGLLLPDRVLLDPGFHGRKLGDARGPAVGDLQQGIAVAEVLDVAHLPGGQLEGRLGEFRGLGNAWHGAAPSEEIRGAQGELAGRRRAGQVSGSGSGVIDGFGIVVGQAAGALALELVGDLGCDLLEAAGAPLVDFFDLDQVPAETRPHRLADLAGFQGEGHIGEGLDHGLLAEGPQGAALFARAVLGVLLGKRGEVLAFPSQLQHVGDLLPGLFSGLRRGIGRHPDQDVARLHRRGDRETFGGGIVGVTDVGVRQRHLVEVGLRREVQIACLELGLGPIGLFIAFEVLGDLFGRGGDLGVLRRRRSGRGRS